MSSSSLSCGKIVASSNLSGGVSGVGSRLSSSSSSTGASAVAPKPSEGGKFRIAPSVFAEPMRKKCSAECDGNISREARTV